MNTLIGGYFKLLVVREQEAKSKEATYMRNVPYSNVVGSMVSTMYEMISTQLNIAHGVGLVSRHMSKSSKIHWHAMQWLLRYLKRSSSLSLTFTKNENSKVKVVGYCDSNFIGDLDKMRSLSRYIFMVGGNAVSWKSSLQHVVALSIKEVEYVVLIECVKEEMWLKEIVNELGFQQDMVTIYCDSQSAIHLTRNSLFHERTKHVDVKLHFIRDVVAK